MYTYVYMNININTHMYTCSCIYMYPALSRVNSIESNMKFDYCFFLEQVTPWAFTSTREKGMPGKQGWLLQYLTVCCSVLACVAAWCSLLQCARSSCVRRALEPHSIAYCVWIYVSFMRLFWHTLISLEMYSSLLYTRVCTCICISTARSIACKYKRLIHGFLVIYIGLPPHLYGCPVFMYICISICIYVCPVCMYICIYAHMYICTSICIYICPLYMIYVHMHICI